MATDGRWKMEDGGGKRVSPLAGEAQLRTSKIPKANIQIRTKHQAPEGADIRFRTKSQITEASRHETGGHVAPDRNRHAGYTGTTRDKNCPAGEDAASLAGWKPTLPHMRIHRVAVRMVHSDLLFLRKENRFAVGGHVLQLLGGGGIQRLVGLGRVNRFIQ